MLRRFQIILFFLFLACKVDAAIVSNNISPVYYFVGREKELYQIETLFKKGESIVSLVGISGIGKTEIVRKYIENNSKNYDIIWIFEGNSDLKMQFRQLAQEINAKYGNMVSDNLDSCVDTVNFFLRDKGRWLFVVDNLKIGNNSIIKHFFKENNNGKIIITSQDKSFLKNIIDVDLLNFEHSADLIQRIDRDISEDDINEIYRNFAGYPILLAQSTYFLKDHSNMFLESLKSEVDISFTNLINKILSELDDKEVKLLIKTASLDNHLLTEKFMLKIAGGEKELLSLTRVNLIVNRKANSGVRGFEMHDLIKEKLLTILDKNLTKETVVELVDHANNIFPKSEHLYGQVLKEYPNLLSNLEYLLKNAERVGVNIHKISELRKNIIYDGISQTQNIILGNGYIRSFKHDFNRIKKESGIITNLESLI